MADNNIDNGIENSVENSSLNKKEPLFEKRSQLSRMIEKMSKGQRIVLGVVSVLSLIMIVSTLFWATSKDEAILYSNLTQKDASSIVTKLKEMNIEYRLEGNGSIIYVESSMVDNLKLSMASEGLPSESTIGYELFDNNKLGMTDFMQRINSKRALEGEISRTINSLKGVVSSRVHLVIPKRALFEEDKHDPSASIALTLRNRAGVTNKQIEGILNLVANSVEGLRVDNISIVDNYGNQLNWHDDPESIAGISSNQFRIKRSIERSLENQVQSMLDRTIGLGRTVVRVNTELNFDKVEKMEELYNPENQVTRSEERNENSATGENGNNQSTESSISNYEINKSTASIIKEVGNVKKLSIAVSVDGKYQTVTDADGEVRTEYVQRSNEELENIKSLVTSAVGFDKARGDVIEVVNLQFTMDHELLEQAKGLNPETIDFIKISLKYGSIMLLIIILLLVVRGLIQKSTEFSRKIWPKIISDEISGKIVTPDGRIIDAKDLQKEEDRIKEDGENSRRKSIEEDMPEEVRKRNELQEQIRKFVVNNSKDASSLLKSWLYEESGLGK
ncbi:MAG: flagellar M-ring protein FliF [Candidatus Cloacimonadota bacterium]|nr:MAG: flagellar M-ring protein FliF [Candidatus Cloacimonadota bacterium]PIE77980.1 MAG: flagellar M-ring protein FliF [Candidatus Delongbacteria bacterium]